MVRTSETSRARRRARDVLNNGPFTTHEIEAQIRDLPIAVFRSAWVMLIIDAHADAPLTTRQLAAVLNAVSARFDAERQ